jgi:hypothetical protein
MSSIQPKSNRSHCAFEPFPGSLDEFLLEDLSDPGSTQRRWAIIFRPVALCVSSSEKTAKQGGHLFLHV